MYRNQFFLLLFLLLVLLALIHILGTYLFWYWRILWLDMAVHFLGGFWVGGMFLWFYFLSGYIRPRTTNKFFTITFTISVVFIVGLLWEFFELQIGALFINEENYFFDTITDLLAALVGALAVSFYFLTADKL